MYVVCSQKDLVNGQQFSKNISQSYLTHVRTLVIMQLRYQIYDSSRCVLRTGECQAKGGKLSCQLCRYNKCLKVGMDPDLVDKQKSKKQNKLGGTFILH